MLDKIKNFLNIPEIDEDEDDFYEDDYEDEEYTPRTSRRDTVKSSASRKARYFPLATSIPLFLAAPAP